MRLRKSRPFFLKKRSKDLYGAFAVHFAAARKDRRPFSKTAVFYLPDLPKGVPMPVQGSQLFQPLRRSPFWQRPDLMSVK